MGYALSVYLVPKTTIDRAVGRNDAALLRQALAAAATALARYDEQMDAPNLVDNDVDLSHADALGEVFAGVYTDGVNKARYGWAFEAFCGFAGEPLSNAGFSPCRTSWYDRLDEVAAGLGVPLQFTDLIDRPPARIPVSDDWPCVGHWGPATLAAVVPLAAALPGVEVPEQREALETAFGWLRAMAARPGTVVVGFHG